MTNREKPQLNQKWINHHALGIVKALQSHGHETYLVGGCVRDLLLGIVPKDFDIATNAKPNEVRRIIRNAFVIGKRFRLVLVKREEHQFEVATFRRNIREDDDPETLPDGDNIFGSPEEDACRRDFTINALFYDPVKEKLIDFSRGLIDLDDGVIRIIGQPEERLKEDPIRILRAIRLAHKIRFSIDSNLRQAIARTAHNLQDSVLPRRREEFLKFLKIKEPILPFLDCYDLGVLQNISPTIFSTLESPESHDTFIRYMNNFHDKAMDTQNPIELFAGLILAYVRSTIEPDPHNNALTAKTLLEDPKVLHLMKNELGMFNYEQELVAKAIQLQPQLADISAFRSKSEKKQLTFFRNEAFTLSLSLAHRDYSLSAENLHYWEKSYLEALPQIEAFRAEHKKKGRTRRPKNKPR